MVGDASDLGDASGRVTGAGTDLLGGGLLTVGRLSGVGAKTVSGRYDWTDGRMVRDSVIVGLGVGSGSAGTVTGEMNLTRAAGSFSTLHVGEALGTAATVSGIARLTQSVVEVERFAAVGTGLSGGTGDGALELVDSRLVVGGPVVYPTLDDDLLVAGGTGDGRLALTRSLVEVTDLLSLGTAP